MSMIRVMGMFAHGVQKWLEDFQSLFIRSVVVAPQYIADTNLRMNEVVNASGAAFATHNRYDFRRGI
jgi:hypothetical protein